MGDPKTGKVITKGGRGMIDSDPEGLEFPWHPKPLNELDGRCTEYINDASVLVAFDDSAEGQAAMTWLIVSSRYARFRRGARSQCSTLVKVSSTPTQHCRSWTQIACRRS